MKNNSIKYRRKMKINKGKRRTDSIPYDMMMCFIPYNMQVYI